MVNLSKQLGGKTVWITGASSGIGKELALTAGNAGAAVILSARREDALADTLAQMNQSAQSRCHIVPLDLGQPESIKTAVETVRSLELVPDLVIHNGGISQRAIAADTDMDIVRQIMEVNFFGAVGLTHATLPMLRQTKGRIVVISSLVGIFGTPLRSTYSASKHALHGYFESLAAEEYKNGVGVTIVCPGFVRTNVSLNAVTADGSAHAQVDAAQKNAMDVAQCASRIWAAVDQKKEMAIIAGPKEGSAVWLKRFAPGLLREIIRKVDVT